MPVKLKDIEGLMVEELHSNEYTSHKGFYNIKGWNDCRNEQGSKSIGLNRERLAEWFFNDTKIFLTDLSDGRPLSIPNWKDANEEWRKPHYIKADTIIAKEAELLEVKEEL